MSDVDQSLLVWLNANRLSRECTDLSDLSDGQLLWELLTQVSAEAFPPLDTHIAPDDWIGKLERLRKMYSSLITYLEATLQLQHPLITADLDLTPIAMHGDKSGLHKLLQLIILAVTRCENREIFIARMRKLSENVQTGMMVFIRGTLAVGETGDIDKSPKCSAAEFARLRQENYSLSLQTNQFQTQIDQLAAANDAFFKEIESLKAQNQSLEALLRSKPRTDTSDKDSQVLTLEATLAQKERVIVTLHAQLEEERRISEGKLATLKDELHVAGERISKSAGVEATLQKYKRKFEDYSEVKAKLKRLIEENEELKQQMKASKENASVVGSLQKQVGVMKEKLQKVKGKYAEMKGVMGEKEEQVKKLQEGNTELQGKLQLSEIKCREATEQLDRLLLWESSEVGFSLEGSRNSTNHREILELTQELAQAKFLRTKAEEELQALNTSYSRDVAKLKAEITASGNIFAQESASLRLKIQQLEAELTTVMQTHNAEKTDLLAKVQFLDTHFRQIEEELKTARKEKETAVGEVRGLRKEKEELMGRYLESREQEVKLIKELSERQVRYQALETAHHLEESKSHQSKSDSEVKLRSQLIQAEQRISQLETETMRTQVLPI